MSDITSGDGKQKTRFLWTKNWENESHVTEGLVSSVFRGNTSHKGVFVLLNDRTICAVFTQTVPGSLEKTDSAPERWEIILHSQPSLAALFLSQSESLRRDILSEGRRAAGLSEWGNLTTWSQPGLWWARRNEREIFFCARGITMLFWKRVTSRRTVGVNDRFIVELMILQRSPSTHTV